MGYDLIIVLFLSLFHSNNVLVNFIHQQIDFETFLKILTSSFKQCFSTCYFQDSSDEAKQKSEDLLTACEELQKLLKESNEGTCMCMCW